MKEPNQQKISELIKQLLVELGEDPSRDGLLKSPDRIAKSLMFLTHGYFEDPHKVVNNAVFESNSDNMVIVRDIEIYSMCEHHLLPFYGKCHIGYISNGKVIGLSKVARIADCFSRRLQIQEHLTAQIAEAIMNETNAEGVGVVMDCKHLCMMMRGVEKQNSSTLTSSLLGSFRSSPEVRAEFMSLIH